MTENRMQRGKPRSATATATATATAARQATLYRGNCKGKRRGKGDRVARFAMDA